MRQYKWVPVFAILLWMVISTSVTFAAIERKTSEVKPRSIPDYDLQERDWLRDPMLEGITEVEVRVSPERFAPAVTRMVASRIKVVPTSLNLIIVEVNIGRGGMMNFQQIYFGTVEVKVFRPARIVLNPQSPNPKLSNVIPVNVWTGGTNFYNDINGEGMDESILRSASELINRLQFEPAKKTLNVAPATSSSSEPQAATELNVDVGELFKKARELYNAGRDVEALFKLREVINNEPMHAAAYLYMGRIYQRGGHLDEAISRLKTALFWDKKLVDAYILLSKVYLQRRGYPQALNYVREALHIDANNQEAINLKRQIEKR